MTKKERIAELERKVAELEADRLARQFYIPSLPSVWPAWRCQCGRTDTHACWISTGSGTSSTYGNILNIGAAS